MIRYLSILLLFMWVDNLTTVKAQNKIALKPDYKNNLSWQQTVKASIGFGNENSSMKQVFDFTMTAILKDFHNNVPIKIEYVNVNGEQVLYANDVEQESYDNKEGKITADIDKNLCLINEKDIGHLSNDIFMVFPPGPFPGFIPTAKKVRIGTKWSSGKIIPLGPKALKKSKNNFSEINGNFELIGINDGIATILWKGTATDEKRSTNVKWERIIEYDIKSQRFMSNKGELQISESDINIIYHIDIVAEY